MAGILSVSQIQGLASSATPTTVEIASGHKISGAAGSIVAPGMVLQTSHATKNTGFQTTSTSFVSAGLSAAITPLSSSSKILINTSLCLYNHSNNTWMSGTIYYNGANLLASDDFGSGYIYVNSGGGHVNQVTSNFLHSPSTTSSITYSVFVQVSGGTGTLSVNDTASTITLQELAQ